jgi:hypothetical protein
MIQNLYYLSDIPHYKQLKIRIKIAWWACIT